ncbi:MAG: hypothetical protein QG622_1703 [Actinomycetota bacterium]|nr:hypothetical protein [Actinomycetota bacterium]
MLGGVRRRARHAAEAAYFWLRPRPTGSVVGLLFFCMSVTPSLIPRPWLAQGLISGITLFLGYAIGSLVGRAGTFLRRIPPVRRVVDAVHPRAVVQPTEQALVIALVLLVVAAVYQGSAWQRDLHLLSGLPAPDRWNYLRVPGVAALVLAGSVVVVRALRGAGRYVSHRLRRWIPPGPLQLLGTTAALMAVTVIAEEIAAGGFLTASERVFSAVNDVQSSPRDAPARPTRSGSPGSAVSWDSLGAEGRVFVAGGPTTADLVAFEPRGGPVKDPVRVYVGLRTTADTRAAAALAVRELERTGAFSRSVLCVVTTTGTGWIDPYLTSALEYEHRGDTAIVGMQYSYLPSWISHLSERGRVARAGSELFEQVRARWSLLPPGRRPKLVVFAESLGALGSEAGFRSLADVRARTDGVLWSGPTHENLLWHGLVSRRDPGTPEVLPVYGSGREVRFASRPEDLTRPDTPWISPRVVYLQNPSDPVTWWTPSLLWRRPDWLEEPRGRDVLEAMRWFPVVTFVQVSGDLALAYGAPSGHGHSFHPPAAAAWAAITSPSGWTAGLSERLTRHLDALNLR